MTPLVSVLMASRNGARFLPAALDGLEAQTFPAVEVEYILVDDGSTDATPAALEEFARHRPHARVLHTPGIGLAAALARAASQARGNLFARHDDDDVSEPRRLEAQVAFLMLRGDVDVLGVATEEIDETGRVTARHTVPLEPLRIRRMLRRAPPFVHGSVMMRRGAYERAGGYRGAFLASQDYDLWLRFGDDTRLANLPDVLYRWRRHPGGVFMRERRLQIRYHALARTFAEQRRATGRDDYEDLARAGSLEAFLTTYSRAGRFYRYLGEDLVREGCGGEARAALAEARRRGVAVATLPWVALSYGVDAVRRGRRRSDA